MNSHVMQLNSAPACEKPAVFPLVLASEGEEVCIRAIGGDGRFVRRMMDLGLRAGAHARIAQHNAAGLVLALDGMRLALGPAAATHVMVSLCHACAPLQEAEEAS